MLVKKGPLIYEVRYELWFCGKNASYCNESSKGKWKVIILHKFLLKQEGWNFVQNSLSLKYTAMFIDYQTLIIQNLFFLKSCWIYVCTWKKGTYFNLVIFRNIWIFLVLHISWPWLYFWKLSLFAMHFDT